MPTPRGCGNADRAMMSAGARINIDKCGNKAVPADGGGGRV